MNESIVTLSTADGPMDAFVAAPGADGPCPALVIVQEAFGVNAHIRDVVRRFAAEGYVALAPEMFHRSGAAIEISYDDMPPAMAQLGTLTNAGIEMDVAAAFGFLRARPDVAPARVGIVGFCMGGFAAFLVACRLDPAVTVSFYGGGIARERPKLQLRPLLGEVDGIRAPILCVFGAEDQGITPDDVAAIRARLEALPVPHDVVVYPEAGHAFFSDRRPSYREAPAREAWRLTLDWLAGALAR